MFFVTVAKILKTYKRTSIYIYIYIRVKIRTSCTTDINNQAARFIPTKSLVCSPSS